MTNCHTVLPVNWHMFRNAVQGVLECHWRSTPSTSISFFSLFLIRIYIPQCVQLGAEADTCRTLGSSDLGFHPMLQLYYHPGSRTVRGLAQVPVPRCNFLFPRVGFWLDEEMHPSHSQLMMYVQGKVTDSTFHDNMHHLRGSHASFSRNICSDSSLSRETYHVSLPQRKYRRDLDITAQVKGYPVTREMVSWEECDIRISQFQDLLLGPGREAWGRTHLTFTSLSR